MQLGKSMHLCTWNGVAIELSRTKYRAFGYRHPTVKLARIANGTRPRSAQFPRSATGAAVRRPRCRGVLEAL